VGPKHSGKSSVGKELAVLLNALFLDLDSCIEERTAKTPRALYKEGTEVFRKAELETLQAILADFPSAKDSSFLVLAAGGGIIDNQEAASLLKEKTFIINLDVSADTAWKRIIATSQISGELPPFLQTDNPEKTHRELHVRRNNAYKELSDITIDADNINCNAIAEHITKILAPYTAQP
jgi:shikimate kinase